MKKGFLAVLLGTVLALALVPSAQAADPGKYLGGADFNFRGQYWMWGTYQENIADFDSDRNDTRRSIFQRFRWYFDTSYEGKYGGTLGFEWNWRWGSVGAANAIGGGPDGDDLTDNTRLKHAYVWFMLPWAPVNSVKVSAGLGIQPSIDPQNIMFASNDFFGVRVDVPIIKGIVNLTGAWLIDSIGRDPGLTVDSQGGFGGGPGASAPDRWSDDSDYYILHATANVAKWLNLGAYWVWGHAMENGRLDNLAWGAGAPYGTPGFPFTYTGQVQGILGGRNLGSVWDGDVYWNGLYFFLKPDPWFVNGHVNVMYGNSGLPHDVTIGTAWAYFLQAGWRSGPFMVSARGWWFDGDKDTDRRPGHFAGPGDKWDRWFGPDPFFASTELWYSGYTSWGTGITGYESSPGGTAFVGMENSWQVTKKLKLDFLFGYLMFTNDSDKPYATMGEMGGGVFLPPNKDKEIGWEFNLAGTYKLYDNLALTLGFNYLIAGDGLDHWQRTRVGQWEYRSADDAYEIFWRLLYTF
jgi:hypothetical protein